MCASVSEIYRIYAQNYTFAFTYTRIHTNTRATATQPAAAARLDNRGPAMPLPPPHRTIGPAATPGVARRHRCAASIGLAVVDDVVFGTWGWGRRGGLGGMRTVGQSA